MVILKLHLHSLWQEFKIHTEFRYHYMKKYSIKYIRDNYCLLLQSVSLNFPCFISLHRFIHAMLLYGIVYRCGIFFSNYHRKMQLEDEMSYLKGKFSH